MLVLIVMIAGIIALSGCAGPAPTPIPTPTETGTGTIVPTETTPVVTETIPPKEGIKFVDVDKGSITTADIEENTLFIAGSIKETDNFTKWDSDLSKKVKLVNTENMLIVGIFLVEQTDGFTIEAKDISQTEDKIRITVSLTAPKEGANQVITYPYHVIMIPREQTKISSGTVWQVYDEDGNLLAETTYP